MLALGIIAWVSIALGALAAIIIYVDIQMGRYQGMPIMNMAWPITALFLWPIVLFVYFRYGRARTGKKHKHPPAWVNLYISSTHCASGCSVADIIGETAIYILGLTIAGSFIWMGYIVDYALALLFGLAFQYYSIKPMQPKLSAKATLWQAFKADILSLTSFQIGMYAWLFVSIYVIFNEQINASSPIFWFMMQIGMAIGMITTMPVNYWLVKVGIKHHCMH